MKKKNKSRSRASKQQATGTISHTAMRCFGIGVCLVLLCSCLSFDIGDWPSGFAYPHNSPAANWCGSIGAFCAYYLLYYIGPGVFIVLISAVYFWAARLAQRPINQPVLRAVGLALVAVASSITFQYLWPHWMFSFPSGSGGVLGVGAAQLLRSHFAALGTFILVAALWAVGAVLLADGLIVMILRVFAFGACKFVGIALPAWAAAKQHSQVLNEIWRELSARQKPLAPALEAPKPRVVAEPVAAKPESDLPRRLDNIPVRAPATAGPEKPMRPESRVTKSPAPPPYENYQLPPMDLLAEPEYGYSAVQEKIVKAKATALEKLLSEFNVHARVVAADTGPVVTMFELELAAGVKVSQIASLANDMARALGVGAVRVVAPLPGKHTIGIEVPNSEKERVRIKNLMQLAGAKPQKMHIPLYLGKDSSAEALVSDLTKMPHLLIAGTTGSGKSVCINSIIVSVLLTKRPDEVKMILIDPKMVEMTAFNTIPHLMCPIVTETQMAVQILEWATVKMDERYALLAEARVKNIAEFNTLDAEEIIRRFNPSSADEEQKIPKKLPYIVIIIDELADLMMTAPKEIEAYIVRLAQKSRAVGIHIVLATQRPQATVVTGLIKSNMPTRIGFRVAARMDSRIILDQNGAETLLGEGDMLFLKPGTSELIRAQGTFMDEAEIKRIVKHLKEVAEPQFHPELTQLKKIDTSEMARDELFDEAVRIVLETGRGSVSLLQRRLNVGYARASRIIEMMAASGILGEYKGSQARELMMTLEEYERIRGQMEADAEAGYQDLAETEGSPEPAYISEGQQGYISTDSDTDTDDE
ncbi:MAG TPA: DNA translocase FtsK 4TM domain-containing protein [Sedimentisphaerales bacterium]|nr:DNA translocase FtsK 4TM domain-containing protein [Sedimentisphaerales bacterium]